MRRQAVLGFLAALIVAPAAARGETVTQIKDICPGAASSSPSMLTVAGGKVFFVTVSCTGSTNELWVTDGTAAGTTQVKVMKSIGGVAPFGSGVIMRADDGTAGPEPWKSDGTPAGTLLVHDIVAGANGSNPSGFTALGGAMLFSASDPTHGYELWKTDGTDAGTVLIKDINVGTTSGTPGWFVPLGGMLYFQATTAAEGAELWKTDGTTFGTVQVRDLVVGTGSSSPAGLFAFNGAVYFEAQTSGVYTLWRSDGTAGGTVQLSTVNNPSHFTAAGGSLFFTGITMTNGSELWKTDGTPAGTALVRDINPGSLSASILYMTSIGTSVFLGADDGVDGTEPWISDGTSGGTTLIKDIQPGGIGSAIAGPISVGGVIYFRALESSTGAELWRSDGTAAGTTLVRDLSPGAPGSAPLFLTVLGQRIFFNASDGLTGSELWAVDLSCQVGTHLCSGSCVDDHALASCGNSCTACPGGPANATATCDGMHCGYACNSGFFDCGGHCETSCCQVNADCATPPSSCFLAHGFCTAGLCTYPFSDGTPCDADLDKCTPNDVCRSGVCVPDAAHRVSCVNLDCRTAACDPGSGDCVYSAVTGGSCGANGCYEPGTCNGGVCSGAPLQICTGSTDPCKSAACSADSGTCESISAPNGTACTSDDACLVSTPACYAGTCTGARKSCPAPNDCNQAECNAVSGACETSPVANGTPCVPDGCVGAGQCLGGQCSCGDGAMMPAPQNGCDCAIGGARGPIPWAALLLFLLLLRRRRRATPVRSTTS